MRYLIIFAAFVAWTSSWGQVIVNDWGKTGITPQSDFRTMRDAGDAYFSTHEDASEGGSYAKFERWKTFWNDRVWSTSGDPGSFRHSQEALASLLADPVCTNGGINPTPWLPHGPSENTGTGIPNLGMVTAVAMHPSDLNTAFAGLTAGSLWRTTNALDPVPTWTCVLDYLRLPGLGINDIRIAASNPDIIYAATGNTWSGGYGIGVVKSTDGGTTWAQVGPVDPDVRAICRKLAVHPTDPDVVYAVVNDELYKTVDGGGTWVMVYQLPYSIGFNPFDPNNPARLLRDVIIDPTSPNIIYASSDDHGASMGAGNTDGAIFVRSVDDGATWTQQVIVPAGTNSDRMTIATTSAAPGSVWAFFRDYDTGLDGLWRSYDNGLTWTTVANSYSLSGGGYWRQDLAISPTDASVMYAPAYYANKSINGGAGFAEQVGGQHIDTRCMEAIVGSAQGTNGANDVVIHGNDGGVTITLNGGTTWTNINGQGFNTSMFYGVGASEKDFVIGGGRQDNDVAIVDDSGWQLPQLVQDGAEAVCHRWDPNILYAQRWCCSYSSKQLYIYKRTGSTWAKLATDYKPSTHALNVRPMLAGDDGYLYAGYEDVYRSATPTDPVGLNWTKISDFDANFPSVPINRPLRSITVCARDPQTMYAAYSDACWGCGNAQGYLFRTTTGGGIGAGDWEDITGNLPSVIPNWTPISNVLVDPTNPLRLWVTMTGYGVDAGGTAPYNGEWRVAMSEDGGDTWTDYSTGLTPFVITDMVYQKGSDRGLYVSTDVGVFYRDASMSQWECYNNGLPVCIISDLEIDHCQGKLIAASMGRGVWTTNLMSTVAAEELVTGVVAINSPRDVAATIRVTGGSTLNVNADLYMLPGVKIIVEPGARMNVDGARLTARCDGFWPGIEVWGDNSHNQSGSPIPTYQGMVVLRNGATIEHAREAFNVMGPTWGTFGGVVQCTDAHFINCRRSSQFLKFQNTTTGGTPIGNRSHFTNCTFVVDDNYRGVDDFYAHVSMWYVDGIRFTACSFRNEQTGITESSKLGMGIISLDAKYTVTGKCGIIIPCCDPCPDANWTKGTFVGLDHGIHALNGVTDRAFTVDRCRFENNVLGVFASGMTNYSVTRNEFVFGNRSVTLVGPIDAYFEDRHRAIFSHESSGFRIEENTLSRDPSPNSAECDGIVVAQSMDHNDQVYKNTATGMKNAYIGEGQCIDLSFASAIGLQFLCDINNGNDQNFWARMSDHPDQNLHAIRTQQGSPAKSAGNTFDQENGTMNASDFRNSTNWPLGYWHFGGISEPLDYTLGYVAPAMASSAHQCASNFNSGIHHVLGVVKRGELEQELVERKAAYISSAYLFNSLLDGGNTDAVVEEVVESWPQDAWELRNYLMGKSPYLSVEVLKEMMIKNILPLPMVLEICVANPEATKKEGFIRWAQYEAPNPLSQYMVDMVIDSWDERTFRMELEATMGQHHADMSRAGHLLLVHFKNDTITEPTDSLKMTWGSLPNFGARMAQAMTMAQRGEYDDAIAHLNEAREDYPLKGGREAEIDRAIGYYGFLKNLALTGRDETALTITEQDALAAMANDTYDRPSEWIWNLLCFGYGRCRPVPSGGEQPTHRAFRPMDAFIVAPATSALSIVPNPADVTVTFRYVLPSSAVPGMIVVRDASGREVVRLPLRGAEGQQLWDSRQLLPGAYTIDLLQDDVRIATEQLLIKR